MQETDMTGRILQHPPVCRHFWDYISSVSTRQNFTKHSQDALLDVRLFNSQTIFCQSTNMAAIALGCPITNISCGTSMAYGKRCQNYQFLIEHTLQFCIGTLIYQSGTKLKKVIKTITDSYKIFQCFAKIICLSYSPIFAIF